MTAAVHVLWSTPTVERADAAWLDTVEERRLERLSRPELRRSFLTSRLLVRTVVAEIAGVDAADVRLGYTCPHCGEPHGQPVVTHPGDAHEVRVSLAHAQGRVVVAGTVVAPVGVDVEPVSASAFDGSDGFDDVAFTADERHRLSRLDEGDRAAARATYWVRKEALLKATGQGLRLDPSAADPDPAEAQLRDLDLGRGYGAAVAVLTREPIEVTARRVSVASATAAEPSRAATDAGDR